MKKIDRLCREAKRACEFRGHKIGQYHHGYWGMAYAECKLCGEQVVVVSSSVPGDSGYSGEALTADCRGRKQ